MSISKDNEATDEQPPASVDLGTAIEQMVEDGMPPNGFHMMFFSEDFQLTESCPTNQLLKMLECNMVLLIPSKGKFSKCQRVKSSLTSLHGFGLR